MELSDLPFKTVRLPGLAGDYQATGRLSELVAELGVGYDKYHRFFADLLAEFGGRPDPRRFRNDPAGFAAACDRMQELVRSEAFLRRCWAVSQGAQWADPVPVRRPLVDGRHRLVSITDQATVDEPSWEPPEEPAWSARASTLPHSG